MRGAQARDGLVDGAFAPVVIFKQGGDLVGLKAALEFRETFAIRPACSQKARDVGQSASLPFGLGDHLDSDAVKAAVEPDIAVQTRPNEPAVLVGEERA